MRKRLDYRIIQIGGTMKNFASILALGLGIGLSLGSLVSVNAASSTGQITFCVNKSTNVVTQKAKCSKTERVLSLSKNGVPGPAGSPGPSGPPGSSGSGFSLASYPVLWGQVDALDNATCQEKWSLLIGPYNIESDAFGQPVRNKPWATTYAGSCLYPMPEIFENPMVTEISDIVHGTKSRVAASNVHSVPNGWEATITSMKVKVRLDANWHLCTAADAQYAARNLSARQSGWTATATDEITFSGTVKISWSNTANPSDRGVIDNDKWPYFCGPDSRTSSGVGYRSLSQAWYIPVRFDSPNL